jgi:site-specific DNA-methyltransferase (adenine-specific)
LHNTLYYGDNLQVLRQYIPDESVDLAYLDPPFNSNASYNVLFKERSGEESPAQIKAFTDTWKWNEETERTYELDIYRDPATPEAVKKMVEALLGFLGRNSMMAYLVMMTPRLVQLHRVLKVSGSLYLHCDPTSSHYLKILLDAIFGKEHFLNEITWKRTTAHNDPNRYGRIQDRLLFYSKSAEKTFNRVTGSYSPEQLVRYRYRDACGPFRAENLTAPHFSDTRTVDWRGTHPGPNRQWRFSLDQLERLYQEGRILLKRNGSPRKDGYKVYMDEAGGPLLQDIWTDIEMGPTDRQRLGYPTQKPEALLERIIEASSNPGDLILDSFCGCGTAVAVAEKLGRQWVGIDITHLAVAVMKNRLKTMFNLEPSRDYDVVGEPRDVESARTLAQQDRFQFQYWAVSLLEAQPRQEQKRGADKGIDGRLYFIDGPDRVPHSAVIQVKSGHVSSRDIRDLEGVVEREKATMGLFITLEEPTRDMRTEAVSSGFFQSHLWNREFQKIQIRTIAELLEGPGFDLPPRQPAYQPAHRVRPTQGQQAILEGLASD